jgi:WD40 repeat protein
MSTIAATQTVPASAVAYVKNNSLTITARHGEVLDTVLMRPAITDFAVSRDRKSVVVISNATSHGGDLELIDLRSKRRTKLLTSPIYFTDLDGQAREVYADPRISPDGKNLVFAIHRSSQDSGSDAIDAAGPLAVLNFDSGDVRVVPSTINVAGKGPCYSNTPMWSPDGSQVVFNCETGAAITSSDDTKLRMLPTATDQKPWSAVIGWLGSHCVLYVQAADVTSYDTYDLRWLNLGNSQTQDASDLATRQRAKLGGLTEVSGDAAISRTSQVAIHTQFNHWVLPRDSPAHLLGGWPRHTVPPLCR